MKDKILFLIIGILIGAIITTSGFLLYNKTLTKTVEQPQMPQMNQDENPPESTNSNGDMEEPPEKPSGDNGEQPPEKPEDENNQG